MPDSIARANVKLSGNGIGSTNLTLNAVANDRFIGLVSASEIPEDGLLASQVTFGVYHGSRLKYYALHQGGKLPSVRQATQAQSAKMKLTAEAVETDSGVDIYVTWDRKPLAEAEVELFCAEGHKEGAAKTDATGKASFDHSQVEDGLNGVMVGYDVKFQTGKLDGQEYRSESHYLTLTFQDPMDVENQTEARETLGSYEFP